MNKRKIMSLALGLCMVAILAVGGTLAYFKDTDAAANVFTVGNVDIKLEEDFEQNSKLVPATVSADGKLNNTVKKEVSVTNKEGSEDAYVRVHIAIPQILDDGADTFNASKNVLHFNYAPDSIGDGMWDWSKTAGDPYTGEWNYYKENIGGIDYNVYVVTYGTVLKAGETTAQNAIHQVYLDPKATNEDIEDATKALNGNWQILVLAEGAQAAGFDNAYDALNTAFGVPGKYDVDWTVAEKQ